MRDPRRRIRSPGDLLAVLGWTGLAVLTQLQIPVLNASPVRVLVAGSYLLVVPGYTFVAALFPRAGSLSLLERGVFSIGASLALAGLVGIPLDATPWGLRIWTLVAAQATVVGILVSVTAIRRGRVAPDDRATPLADLHNVVQRVWAHRERIGGGSRALQVAIALAVVASLGATAVAVTTPLPSERYTELYVVGPNGTVDSVPDTVSQGQPVDLTVVARNHEHEQVTYGRQVQTRTADGSVSVLETATRSVAHGDSWNATRSYDVPTDVQPVTLEVLLFRGSPPGAPRDPEDAYRSVAIQLTTDQSPTNGTS